MSEEYTCHVSLSKTELCALQDLCRDLGMTQGGMIRAALRLYHTRHIILRQGYSIKFINESGDEYPTFPTMGCGSGE